MKKYLFTATTLRLIVILTSILITVACIKSGRMSDEANSNKERPYKSSVRFVNGKYRIDTALIRDNVNKKTLIAVLDSDSLVDKNTVAQIPDFIKSFIDSCRKTSLFEMANPGEEWRNGIVNFGHQVITKIYDDTKKDSVLQVSYDGKPLPDKQLVYFGTGRQTALLSFNCGGFGTIRYTLIFKFKDEKITDYWYSNNFDDALTQEDIIKNLKSPKKNNGC